MGLFNLTTGDDVFGLDIGYETIKIAQVRRKKKDIYLVGSAEIPLTDRILEKDSFKNKAATANLIKEACKKATPDVVSAKKIVSALPETFVFSKTIQMPKMTEEEYANAISVEAAQYLPIPVDQVYLDYQTLIVHPDEPLADILIVAAPKKLVDEYVEVTKMAGFELVALETKPIAVGRGIALSHQLNGVVVIEIGTEVSRLSIWDSQNIRLITSINVGKNHIVESSGDPGKSLEIAADNLALNTIVDETINAIRYHQNRDYKPNQINNILVSGSGASIPGLDAVFSDKIKIPTEIAAPKLAGKSHLGPEFATCYGLALRSEFE